MYYVNNFNDYFYYPMQFIYIPEVLNHKSADTVEQS
jgi:hypothetical protein